MAHPLNNIINRAEGKEKHRCDNTCEYFKFPHLRTACVLSEVFSVPRDELCYEYKELNHKIMTSLGISKELLNAKSS